MKTPMLFYCFLALICSDITKALPSPLTLNADQASQPDNFTCPNREDGLYANPDDCTTFYQCSNGHPYLLECPPGLYYDSETEVCDYPYNVNCPTYSTSWTSTTATAMTSPIVTTDATDATGTTDDTDETTLDFETSTSTDSALESTTEPITDLTDESTELSTDEVTEESTTPVQWNESTPAQPAETDPYPYPTTPALSM